jgi:hypothetical protein
MYLSKDCSRRKVADDLFIVGVNGSNRQRIRKVVWAGKVSEVMTFAEAYGQLGEERFRELREDDYSPLHVEPVETTDVGYRHRSKLHIQDNDWVFDLVSVSSRSGVKRDGRRLILRKGARSWEAFDRDCCLLLDNVFFAQGQGLKFDKVSIKLLRDAQRGKSGIDNYAIFGLTANGQANGLRGHYLTIDGHLADDFVVWLKDRCHKPAMGLRDIGRAQAKCCCNPTRRRPEILSPKIADMEGRKVNVLDEGQTADDLEDLAARNYPLTTADLDRIGPHRQPPASYYAQESKPF